MPNKVRVGAKPHFFSTNQISDKQCLRTWSWSRGLGELIILKIHINAIQLLK
jgi:hypothetical protein